MTEKQTLDISWEAIVKVVFTLVIAYILYQVSEILVWIVFAIIISILFNPLIDYMQRLRIPRIIGASISYIGVFGIISLFIYALIPTFYLEVKAFIESVPGHIETISPYLHYIGVEQFSTMEEFMEVFRESSETIMANIFNVVGVIFGGFFSAMFIIILAFFLSLEGTMVENAIKTISSRNKTEYLLSVWDKCRNQVSKWFLIRILASAFVGISVFIAFYLLGVKYALLFAVIAAVFNIVPFIGPVVAGILFFIILSLGNIVQAMFAIVAFTIIQSIESALTPLLSKKIMGVSSALVLVAITIGGYLWGTLGAILAIPLLGMIFEFTKAYLQKRNEANH